MKNALELIAKTGFKDQHSRTPWRERTRETGGEMGEKGEKGEKGKPELLPFRWTK